MKRHQPFTSITIWSLLALALAAPAAAEIRDGGHGGNPHFFFLPPMIKAPDYSGVFDATAVPEVRICEWSAGVCLRVIATFTTSGIGADVIRVDPIQQHYLVNWNTASFSLGSFGTGAGTQPYGVCSDGINFWITLTSANKLARF